jgi:hypothetical protein
MRKSKPYAEQDGEQVESTQNELNYLAGAADRKLREITQRSAEYRTVESFKQAKLSRDAIAAIR